MYVRVRQNMASWALFLRSVWNSVWRGGIPRKRRKSILQVSYCCRRRRRRRRRCRCKSSPHSPLPTLLGSFVQFSKELSCPFVRKNSLNNRQETCHEINGIVYFTGNVSLTCLLRGAKLATIRSLPTTFQLSTVIGTMSASLAGLVRSFIRSFICSFIHAVINTFNYSFIYSLFHYLFQ